MTKNGMTPSTQYSLSAQLVIAHYNEDLRWLRDQKWKPTIIYTKGTDSRPIEIEAAQLRLPNVGRESHTYLYHIVSNYHRLADVTIFCQAGVDDHVNDASVDSLVRETSDAFERGMTGFGIKSILKHWEGIRYKERYVQELRSGRIRRSTLSPGDFFRWVFGEEPPSYVPFYAGATLGVHRQAIVSRELSFYERLLGYFEELEHSNPEEGHYLERFWVPVFDPDWTERVDLDSFHSRSVSK